MRNFKKILTAVVISAVVTLQFIPMSYAYSDMGWLEGESYAGQASKVQTTSGPIGAQYDVEGVEPEYGWYGDGSATDYHITKVEELLGLSYIVNDKASGIERDDFLDKNIILNNDLDLGVISNWPKIGDNTDHGFNGCLDGGDWTINNLRIDSSESYEGLFGYIAPGGWVQNLKVSGEINCSGSYVGSIAGYTKGGISNCTNSATINAATGTYVGGLLGYSLHNSVFTCVNEGNVTSQCHYVGGLVGHTYGTIRDSYNSGSITGLDNVGGLVGRGYDALNCSNSGSISGQKNVGGLAGVLDVTIISCNYGTVSGTEENVGGMGGICGQVNRCFNSGKVTSDNDQASVGALRGYKKFSIVVDSYYNTDTSAAVEESGFPLTTSQMTGIRSFDNMKRFDGAERWKAKADDESARKVYYLYVDTLGPLFDVKGYYGESYNKAEFTLGEDYTAQPSEGYDQDIIVNKFNFNVTLVDESKTPVVTKNGVLVEPVSNQEGVYSYELDGVNEDLNIEVQVI